MKRFTILSMMALNPLGCVKLKLLLRYFRRRDMVPRHVIMNFPTRLDREPGPLLGLPRTRRPGGRLPGLGIKTRAGLMALALGLTVVFVIAARLRPDPRGYGTHEQLGRPPCAILKLTGRPCPSCGMTTAFAWFVRGELARSWRANPSGLLAASMCVPLIPWLVACSVMGRPLGVRSPGETLMALVVVASALAVLTWFVRRSLSLL